MLTLRNGVFGALGHSSRNLIAVGLLLSSACGDDSDEKDSIKDKDAGSESNSSSKAGRGGSGGSGTPSSTAGRAGELPRMTNNQNSGAYTCKPRPEDSGGTGRVDSRCCAGMGVCKADISEGISHGFPHDTCSADDELRCVPNMRIVAAASGDQDHDAGAAMAFNSCRVSFPGAPADFADYEGRCLPSCFAKANPIAGRLSQGTCVSGELCAPCFDPLTGVSTGSCELQGDQPTESPPAAFGECADGLGYCVPAFAAGSQAMQLTQLTCKQGELCGPKNKVADPNACFAHCDAGSFGAGACVPAFIATVAAGILQRGECAEGEICGPCELFGTRSGICD
jgi:hypothetical protein